MTSIKKIASNCETCITKPCQIGCPLDNDIPSFIKKIKEENYKEAFNILSNTSVLMPVCGRICPHMQQCMGSCVKGVSYEPVNIGALESFVGDLSLDKRWKFDSQKNTNYKVAVIGGGPAGLTCAAFLRRNGIGVTIYEKYDYLGGILAHGIPEFRLPKQIVKKVTDNIINLGIEVKYNQELGKNITLGKLKKEYDAIFLGIGANSSNKMNIPGEGLQNVYGANELLEHNIDLDYTDKTVVVSGGGNVAMDVARTIQRKGAKKVIVIYRRTKNEMPAEDTEEEAARVDGVKFLYLTNILEVKGKNKVESIEVVKTKLVKKEGESRLSPVNIEGSNYKIECDYVIMAVGSHTEEFVENLNLNINPNRRTILINKEGQTSDKKVFSGGDVAGTKGTVAWASRAGRNAAYGIIKYLNNK